MMPMFTKKPVTIEAREYTKDKHHARIVADWCGGIQVDNGCIIKTLEGDHLAKHGDMIIRGVKGEFYPCKPDIFAKTYELA